jgi:aminomethyltransferase
MLTLPLAPCHEALHPKWAPFAGYDMPLSYAGTLAEHIHTRTQASLFDVSHMGQAVIRGPGTDDLLRRLTPMDPATLKPGMMRYSVLTHENGGIVDDVMVLRRDDDVLMIVNAGNKAKVNAHIADHLTGDVTFTLLENTTILALQGPRAKDLVPVLFPDASALSFLTHRTLSWGWGSFTVSRSGYTGEDGFEFYGADEKAAAALFQELIVQNGVKPAGLGARDTLRLEAGLCLYGLDLSDDTTPVEAGLSFVIQKAQRENPTFLGHETILPQLKNGAAQTLLPLVFEGRQPIRHGASIVDEAGNIVGTVTSGAFSPTRGDVVVLAYLKNPIPQALFADVRGQKLPLTRTALPFVPHRYHRS